MGISNPPTGGGSFSGDYSDLTGKPTLGTAADNAETDFATAAQGDTADDALPVSELSAALDARGVIGFSGDCVLASPYAAASDSRNMQFLSDVITGIRAGGYDLASFIGQLPVSPSFPRLLFVDGSVTIHDDTMESLSLPLLDTVAGDFSPSSTVGAAILVPALRVVSGVFNPNGWEALTELLLPSLRYLGGTLYPYDMPLLTSLALPSIKVIGGTISDFVSGAICMTDRLNRLTSFSLGAGLQRVGGDVIFSDPEGAVPLDQASVDNVLVRLAALDGTNGTTSYDNFAVNLGGRCLVPSATGLAAKTVLEGRGNMVTINAAQYPITAVSQAGGSGVNHFTVADPDADLNGATGNFFISSSTGNDKGSTSTYFITSAVSAGGSTVIVVPDVIADGTADGYVMPPA